MSTVPLCSREQRGHSSRPIQKAAPFVSLALAAGAVDSLVVVLKNEENSSLKESSVTRAKRTNNQLLLLLCWFGDWNGVWQTKYGWG